MANELLVTSSPHIRSDEKTFRIMLDVLIALTPALIAGATFFGLRVLLVAAVTVGSALLFEFAARKAMKRDNTIGDLSAAVTGLLLALCLPPTIPLWIAAVGSLVAVVLVKQLFGGLGQNFMNPALAARVFLLFAWPAAMTGWVVNTGVDIVSTATPLGMLKENAGAALPSTLDLFMGGNIGGSIGETSAFALLLGGLYLLVRRVIGPEIPVLYVGTVALLSWAFGRDPLFQILSGGLILGAFFMATDYATSPVTFKGRCVMGVGCGLLTVLIRFFTPYPEGVAFSILIMNVAVPLIDRWTRPKRFGVQKVRKGGITDHA
jgi:electron transport complex protein RnfD